MYTAFITYYVTKNGQFIAAHTNAAGEFDHFFRKMTKIVIPVCPSRDFIKAVKAVRTRRMGK